MLSTILFHVLRGLVGSVVGVVGYHLYIHRYQDLGWLDPSELRRGDKFSFSQLVDGCQHETVTCVCQDPRPTYQPDPGLTVVGRKGEWHNSYTIPPGQKVRIYRRNP